MRITNKMLSDNYLRDMQTNLKHMSSLQGQLSSGKEIRKPSDNPYKVVKSMGINQEIAANKQYNENIKDTINWLDTTDTALKQAGDLLQRVRELILSSGNAAYGSDERTAIYDEINENVSEMAQILNTSYEGKYVFAGTRGTSKPVGVSDSNGNNGIHFASRKGSAITDPLELNMLKQGLSVEVSQGVRIEYNVTAAEILEFTGNKGGQQGTVKLQEVFNDILNHLKSDNPDDVQKLLNSDLENITLGMDNILKIRAEVGAKQNRMTSAKERNEDENFTLKELLSSNEDIDITEKYMEYSTAQTIYMSALQVSSKILLNTLIDYL
ncbi:MAG: flagellar hook-associated protein FlgL [Clostridiaceae bacterium]